MSDAGRDALPAERAVRARLRACAATRSFADGSLTTIEGGLSNQAWRLEANGDAWFVRLGHPDAARLGVDRAGECALLRVVAEAGLAPPVLACEPAAGLLVTRFIDGFTWRATDVTTDGNLLRVAHNLRRLHTLPIPRGTREVDYARQARHLAARLPQPDARTAGLHARAAAAFAEVAALRWTPSLCHNDLHHLNLVDDRARLWMVDWEYGGWGNPLFDLAGFLTLHDLGPGPASLFVDAYGGPRAIDLAVLEQVRWLFDYVQWLWYRSRFADPAGEEAWYSERLAQRLLRCNN